MNRFQTALPIAAIASILLFTAQAQRSRSHSSSPTPAYRVETLKLKTRGLRPHAAFIVFLASDRIGEISTNAAGRGSMRAEALLDGDSLRQNLSPAVLRFASPAANDICFTPVNGKEEGSPAARSASATTTWITSARSINDDASVFHSINWRSIQCVSTF
jgi:hypothetical protein